MTKFPQSEFSPVVDICKYIPANHSHRKPTDFSAQGMLLTTSSRAALSKLGSTNPCGYVTWIIGVREQTRDTHASHLTLSCASIFRASFGIKSSFFSNVARGVFSNGHVTCVGVTGKDDFFPLLFMCRVYALLFGC